MIIDGVEYVPVESSTKQIIVCHRGYVFLGDVEDKESEVVIRNAKNLRRWGTTYGLGQLAIEGPQPESKIDDAGTVRVHPLAIVCRYDVDASKW